MLYIAILTSITLFANLVFEYNNLTCRGKISLHVFVRIVTIIFMVAGYAFFAFVLGIRSLIPYYLLNAVHFFACLYLFEESVSQKIFQFFTGWIFTTFVSVICNYLSSWMTLQPDAPPSPGVSSIF